jgi:hypothetical protein
MLFKRPMPLIVCLACLVTPISYAADDLPAYLEADFNQLKLKNPRIIDGDNCTVRFVVDKHNHNYVLKQIKNSNLTEQARVIFEYISAALANQVNIPMPQTYLIPQGWHHQAKPYADRVAILQRMVHGKEAPINMVYIKQESLLSENKLAIKDAGLKREIVNYMSLSDDLIKLVALDTFTSNVERSNNNLFYDSNSQHYYGIGGLAAFSSTQLPNYALHQVASYNKQLLPEERASLKSYHEILEKLYDKFPPDKINEYIENAVHTYFKEHTHSQELKEFLGSKKLAIKKDYSDTKKLITYLDFAEL